MDLASDAGGQRQWRSDLHDALGIEDDQVAAAVLRADATRIR
jgi:hypothetical protein